MFNLLKSNRISNWLISIFILTLLISVTMGEPVLMTKQVGELIFQQHKHFLIYVYEQSSPQILDLFNEYCKQRDNCAILNTTVQEYQSVRKFIGKKQNQFFLILNVPFHKKYVLDVDAQKTTKDSLSDFEKQFEQQTLQPFYASQPVPENVIQSCRELVGKTYSEFLKQPSILKVIYTYTKHEACGGCLPLLKDFSHLAERMYKKDVLHFGFVDVFLNDIPKIPEPIVPHFYIYNGTQIIKEVDEADWEDLPEIIKKQARKLQIKLEDHIDDDNDSSSSDHSNQEEL